MIPLILIPGLGSDFAVWQPTIKALGASAECTVGDTLSDDSLPGMAERILSQAPERFSLAGVSMGGMVALEIMRSDPERVQRLALLDTNPCPDTPEQTAQRRGANAAVLSSNNFEALALASLKYLIHPAASIEVRNAMVEMSVRVGAKTYVRQNEAVAARADQRLILSTIEVPTIVIFGAQDLLTPMALSEELQNGIRGAHRHIIPDCGHLPPIEKPDAVASLLREWMGPAVNEPSPK
jgi:pimeloyl-ACP methyl ester carboxylesterase